ncbi:hypothetical protein FKW77_010295 [Venturia effusa]|uniref:Hydrophobin n=1 Tax=Venturia effusa TaxID=50376 RepID=A0A517L0E4_9PEZI|nr:hypothetical protein FKW77_010295 [Venturia effusa]
MKSFHRALAVVLAGIAVQSVHAATPAGPLQVCSLGYLTCCESGVPVTLANMVIALTGCEAATYTDGAGGGKQGYCKNPKAPYATCCTTNVGAADICGSSSAPAAVTCPV